VRTVIPDKKDGWANGRLGRTDELIVEVPVVVRDVGEGVYRTVQSSVVHKGRYGGRAGVEAEREYAFVYLKRGRGSLAGFETGVLRIRRRARHRRGQSLEGDRWRCERSIV